jgi:O-antigen/teichoic acid export membrane protein
VQVDHPGAKRSGGSDSRRRLHPILAGLGVTLGGQVALALCTLVLYSLIARRLGTESFASFSLGKQAVSLLFPVVTVGLVGGLPRAMAVARGAEGPRDEALLGAALAICGVVAGACSVLAIALPDATAAVFFGGEGTTGLVAAVAALLFATAVFHVAYGYLRGRLRLVAANSLQVLAAGLAPLLLLLAVPGLDVTGLLALMAAVLGCLSLAWIAAPLVRAARVGTPHVLAAAGTLLDYGARRVPGEVAQVGLFALVPVLTAHVASLTEVAYLAAALQLVLMLAVVLNPIGIVLLPSLAERWATDPASLARQVGALAGFAAHVALFAGVQLAIYGALALELWLGPEFEAAGRLVSVTLIAAGPFVYYLTMRSSLDAVAVRSYNTRSNLAALAAFTAIAAVLLGFDLTAPAFAVAWAFAGGVVVQGLMTLAFVQRLFAVPLADYALGPALVLAAATGGAAVVARPAVEDAPGSLLVLAALELTLAAAYFGGLAAARAPWTRLLRDRSLRGRP